MHSPSPSYSSDRTSSPDRSYIDSKDHRRGGMTRHGSTGERPFTLPSTATAGTRLAQEIYDEFLVCKICLDAYRNPKCLACLHTFCEECIENHIASESTYKKYSDYREFTCPLCRKRTQLSVGGVKKLTDNFLVSSLSELVARQRPPRYPFCDICKSLSGKHRDATSKCLDCAKLLCTSCVQLHKQTKVTSSHSLFDVEIEKDIECRDHRDEAVRFYCEPCDACVCVLCTFHEHRDHDISHFTDAVGKHKVNIIQLLEQCRLKISCFDEQLETFNRCEDTIHTAEQSIHDTAIAFIQEIRTTERQLIEELHNLYGPECMDCLETRKELTSHMENLRSTCQLTDMILNGKDIELLLLKKDVVDKLTALGTIDLKPVPATSSKVVRFLPGSLDFGRLHDDDRPLVSSLGRARCTDWNAPPTDDELTVSCSNNTISSVEATTQTETTGQLQVEHTAVQTDDVTTASSSKVPGRSATAAVHKDRHLQLARPAKHYTK